MKLYNYYIEFVHPITEKFIRRDEDRGAWVTNKNLAIQNMNEDILWCKEINSPYIKAYKWDIIESDFNNLIVLEGELREQGEYEDSEIYVGNESLYNAFYSKFKGNKVRITMEILKDE